MDSPDSRPLELGLPLPNRAVLYDGTTVEELLARAEAADCDLVWSDHRCGLAMSSSPTHGWRL